MKRFSENIIPKRTVKVSPGEHPNEFVDAHIQIWLWQFLLQKFQQGSFARGGCAVDKNDCGHKVPVMGITKTGVLRLPLLASIPQTYALFLFFGSTRNESFHETALAARDSVLVEHAFFRSLVQGADGEQDSFLSFGMCLRLGLCERCYRSAGSATECTVAQTMLLVLTIAFDL
jgi:hypothetical protein